MTPRNGTETTKPPSPPADPMEPTEFNRSGFQGDVLKKYEAEYVSAIEAFNKGNLSNQ
jgi:hypothetical protein